MWFKGLAWAQLVNMHIHTSPRLARYYTWHIYTWGWQLRSKTQAQHLAWLLYNHLEVELLHEPGLSIVKWKQAEHGSSSSTCAWAVDQLIKAWAWTKLSLAWFLYTHVLLIAWGWKEQQYQHYTKRINQIFIWFLTTLAPAALDKMD